MKKVDPTKLHKLEDATIRTVDDVLFNGSPFGGMSLVSLLQQYRKNGAYHPIRRDLIYHLQRCTDALSEMEATIIARCRVSPNRRIKVKR